VHDAGPLVGGAEKEGGRRGRIRRVARPWVCGREKRSSSSRRGISLGLCETCSGNRRGESGEKTKKMGVNKEKLLQMGMIITKYLRYGRGRRQGKLVSYLRGYKPAKLKSEGKKLEGKEEPHVRDTHLKRKALVKRVENPGKKLEKEHEGS